MFAKCRAVHLVSSVRKPALQITGQCPHNCRPTPVTSRRRYTVYSPPHRIPYLPHRATKRRAIPGSVLASTGEAGSRPHGNGDRSKGKRPLSPAREDPFEGRRGKKPDDSVHAAATLDPEAPVVRCSSSASSASRSSSSSSPFLR